MRWLRWVLTVDSASTINSATATATSATAYTTDTGTIDTGYTVNYGITSDNPAMQQLVAGLRYMQAAGQSTDQATYKAYMTQAASLISSAITSLQGLHTTVANNINVMTNEKDAQNTALTNLTEQVANISQIDTTQVSAELTSMETTLQASYSVTGSILKLSIVSYL